MRRWLPLCALVSACAPTLESTLGDAAAWKAPPAADWPDDAAVVLFREKRLLFSQETRPWTTQQQEHQVVAVLREGALSQLAQVHMRVDEGQELIAFQARTIDPDGTVVEGGRGDLLETDLQRDAGDLDDPRDDEDRQGRFFTYYFPQARVGSVLEWKVTYESKGITRSLRVGPHSNLPFPVMRHRVELTGGPGVRYEARLYNTDAPLHVEDDGGGWRMVWEQKDVPAEPAEAWAPDWHSWRPWMAYRTKQYVVGNWVRHVARTWDDVLRSRATQLYLEHDKQLEGFAEKIDVAGCADGDCLVDRALAFVRDRTEYAGGGSAPGSRKLTEVLREGRATSGQKAFLLWKLLKDAGVDAQFALASRARGRRTGHDFPLFGTYDHTLVHVPAQAGVAEPLWLDAACEHCARGELPARTRDAPVKVLSATARFDQKAEITVRADVARGRAAVESTDIRDIDLVVRPDGAVDGTWTRRYGGSVATWLRRKTRTWSAGRWYDDARDVVRGFWPTGRLVSEKRGTCDKAAGRCERAVTFHLPDHALPVGDTLVVPFTVAARDLGEWDARGERRLEVAVGEPETTIETMRFEVPEGFEVASLPREERLESAALVYALTARVEGRRVEVRRSLSLRAGLWPASAYETLRAPARAFAAARQQAVVLRRVTGG